MDDATIEMGDAVFENCELEVVIEYEKQGPIKVGRETTGTIIMPHPIPESFFFDHNGVPTAYDVTATVDGATIELESLLVTDDKRFDFGYMEFIALNPERTVSEEPVDQTRTKTVEMPVDLDPFDEATLTAEIETEINGATADVNIELIDFEASADLGDLFELTLSSNFDTENED